MDALLDEDELQELKKGRQLAKQEANKGKVEKASNFEILKLQQKEAAAGKKGAKSAQGAKKAAGVEGATAAEKKAKTKAGGGKKK